MRTALLALLLLSVGVTAAEARKRQRQADYVRIFAVTPPGQPVIESVRLQRRDRRGRVRQEIVRAYGPQQLVPPDWQLQTSSDPNWRGNRFVSPDGNSSFAAYSAPADRERTGEYMKSVAFADGEQITALRGERNWIFAAGTKGDRAFYRKARLACGGNTWHHIAFEFPIELQQDMAGIVATAVRAVDNSDADGCEQPVAAAPQR